MKIKYFILGDGGHSVYIRDLAPRDFLLWWKKWPLARFFPPSISVFACHPSTNAPYSLYLHTARTKGTNSRSLSFFPKVTLLRQSVRIGQEGTCPVYRKPTRYAVEENKNRDTQLPLFFPHDCNHLCTAHNL